jgi:hypothetical protein
MALGQRLLAAVDLARLRALVGQAALFRLPIQPQPRRLRLQELLVACRTFQTAQLGRLPLRLHLTLWLSVVALALLLQRLRLGLELLLRLA